MNKKIDNHSYINPQAEEICQFIATMSENSISFTEVIHNIFQWFNDNVKYSRLKQPYYPLQRSDLEVLEMKSGTCGDYSNLLVSVLINMGISAKYAYIKRDCYGSEQNHICAAAEIDGEIILIDATLPYRKWCGFDCHHKEYELYSPKEFEVMMKQKEDFFYKKALNLGNENLAGILYAPWICDDIILDTEDKLESLFYLVMLENNSNWTLWISFVVYTNERGFIPLRVRVDENMDRIFQFLENEQDSLWDDKQWGNEYSLNEIPERMKSEYFYRCLKNIDDNIEIIRDIMKNAYVPSAKGYM